MSQSLTSKYRPQTFAEVAGQETIKRILSRAAAEDRIAPAYLFSGTRGVGKTTIARILAKAINCEHAPTAEPCNQCIHCRQITQGAAVDVVEIDGASNRGIDDARRLKEDIGYAPMQCRYKVFIIDEAHMLTREAFNALLKTLEEPPSNATFILATTEPHKFPATIVSRCQHYAFKRLTAWELEDHLANVLTRESVEFDPAALKLLARRAAGSVRDSMSLMGQVLALGNDRLVVEDVRSILGLAGQELFFRVMEAIHDRDCVALASVLSEILDQGLDLGFFLRELAAVWRNLFLLRQSGEAALPLLELPQEEAGAWLEWAPRFSLAHIHACWQLTLEGQRRVLTSLEPALALELLLLNLAFLPDLLSLETLSAPGASPAGGAGGAGGGPGGGAPYGGAPQGGAPQGGAPGRGGSFGPGRPGGPAGRPAASGYQGVAGQQVASGQQGAGGRPAAAGRPGAPAPQAAKRPAWERIGPGRTQGAGPAGPQGQGGFSARGAQGSYPPQGAQPPQGARAPQGPQPSQGSYPPQGARSPRSGAGGPAAEGDDPAAEVPHQAAAFDAPPWEDVPPPDETPVWDEAAEPVAEPARPVRPAPVPAAASQVAQAAPAAASRTAPSAPVPSAPAAPAAQPLAPPSGPRTWEAFLGFVERAAQAEGKTPPMLNGLTAEIDANRVLLTCANGFRKEQLANGDKMAWLTGAVRRYFGPEAELEVRTAESGPMRSRPELRQEVQDNEIFQELQKEFGARLLDCWPLRDRNSG